MKIGKELSGLIKDPHELFQISFTNIFIYTKMYVDVACGICLTLFAVLCDRSVTYTSCIRYSLTLIFSLLLPMLPQITRQLPMANGF